MKGHNLVKLMCPKNCAGRDGHVHPVRSATEVHMPQEVWDKYKDDPAYRCSYCDSVWFQGKHAHVVIVGLYRGMVFEKLSEPLVVHVEKEKKKKR